MTNPSNLYAEKIFAEHPLSLWALDDKADYISLISESQRDLSNWTVSGGSSLEYTDIFDEPFPYSYTGKIIGNIPTGEITQLSAVSDDIVNFTDLDDTLQTFSVGGYFYSQSSFINGFELGYQYYDSTSGTLVEHTKTFNTPIVGQWQFISETFAIPSENTTMRIVFKINYLSGSANTNDYHFLVNGITLGQWSEEFNSISLGTTKQALPTGLFTGTHSAIPASSYGFEENYGYYFVKNNRLVAKNAGVPIVYGSSSVTVISPNDNLPSLIVPGKGFLNSLGQYKDYTAEFWIRLSCDAIEPKKIFGNIHGDNGLWVQGPFFILKIGDNTSSHFVGEWDRPMLIDIRISNNNAGLLINGEEVISMNFLTSDLYFPDPTSNNLENDWLGFWSYTDVSSVQIDCVAIYPYKVSSIMAKRRFVYGQGVDSPENTNSAYSGTSVAIDYSFADYTNNYDYPNIGRWSQGSLDNISIENNILSTPTYSLPIINFDSKTQEDFYVDNSLSQNESSLFFSLKPNLSTWTDTNGYVLFENLNFLKEDIKCFYGVFKSKQEANNETLIHIESENSTNYFNVSLNGSDIIYKIKYNNIEEVVYTAVGYQNGNNLTVGLHIDSLVSYFGGSVASFFGNRGGLKLYVGGSKLFTNTFSGNIYRFGFCTDKNYKQIESLFNEIGLPINYENVFSLYGDLVDYDAGNLYFGSEASYWDYILDGGSPSDFAAYMLEKHLASYTLTPTTYFDNYSLDIDIDASWKDYLPLTYFAQYVTDVKGNSYYDLDLLQFNINYPEPSYFKEDKVSGTWTYSELQQQFSNPIRRTYASLDNQLFTGYDNYSDLENKSTTSYSYDTSNSFIKTYISFEYVQNGANAIDQFFTYVQDAPRNGILQPGANWINTKYEIVNNMIIYPPSGTDFNDVKIVMHVDFKLKNSLKNKVNIKNLQICSQAFNDVSPNPIGTKFGTQIYPYRKSGIYYDYKGKNPFTIYKGSSPYLNLTKYSGIELKGNYNPLVERGISIPVNNTVSSDYKVIAVQATIRYGKQSFPYAPTEIFEIKSKNALIKFFLVANSQDGQRAKIYAVNAKTGELENGIAFYWNGNLVKEPVVTIKEWGFLGISFGNALDFSNVVGSINVTGPILVNNISYYQSTSLQEVSRAVFRPWYMVKNVGQNEVDWDFWTPYYWNGVLVLSSSSSSGVTPSTIYKIYTGTNKIIVGDGYDKKLNFGSYEYLFYKDVSWQQKTLNAI